jgi:L-fuconolactonase
VTWPPKGSSPMIVDAHHHLWDPATRAHAWLDGLPALRRRFGMEEFRQVSAGHEVAASILVQVLASTAETEEFLAVAAMAGPVAGVVGWADLTSPGVAEEIGRLRQLPGGDRLVGIRHLVQDEPDPAWLDRRDVRHGLRALGDAGLAYDLLVRPGQLPAALRAASDLGGVRFILDHGGKPDIAGGQFEPWARLVGELASRPNVTCKLSGLVTEAAPGWDSAQIAPYADWLLDCFGPARLMFGSDWPVCNLAASYRDVLALARTLLASRLGPADIDTVLAGSAITAYSLRLPG